MVNEEKQYILQYCMATQVGYAVAFLADHNQSSRNTPTDS